MVYLNLIMLAATLVLCVGCTKEYDTKKNDVTLHRNDQNDPFVSADALGKVCAVLFSEKALHSIVHNYGGDPLSDVLLATDPDEGVAWPAGELSCLRKDIVVHRGVNCKAETALGIKIMSITIGKQAGNNNDADASYEIYVFSGGTVRGGRPAGGCRVIINVHIRSNSIVASVSEWRCT